MLIKEVFIAVKKVLCSVLCLILIFSVAPAFAAVIPEGSPYYPRAVRELLDAYQNGEYGDEVYHLTIVGGWMLDEETIVITVKDGAATLSYTERNRERTQTRVLSAAEYQALVSYMDENKVDSLPSWDTGAVMDGVWYYLTHITPDDVSYVYINNPGVFSKHADAAFYDEDEYENYIEIYGDDSVYVGLVDMFWSFIENGSFEISHSSGAKVLVPREKYNVQAVWKNGDDFRICIKNDGGLEWRSFRTGAVGEVVPEPEGLTLADAWADDPGTYNSDGHLLGYIMSTSYNSYPWQCSWNGYRVRYIWSLNDSDSGTGIWLTAEGQDPKRISSDDVYAELVVIPGTDYVVCAHSINGWAKPNDIVKINLITGEETVLGFEPADNLDPVTMIGDELLVIREQEKYLWNPATDVIRHVTGDFHGLSYITYRFLQKADGENRYYTSDTDDKDKTAIGILDTEKFEFTPIAEYGGIYIPPMDMWVDAENSKVYASRNGDLLELPLPGSVSGEWTVIVNGARKDSIEIIAETSENVPVTLVPLRSILEALGADVQWEESTGNVYFKYDNTDYACKFAALNENFPENKSLLVCRRENIDSIYNDDYIQLNPMSADGAFRIVDGKTYIYISTFSRLFSALGCTVKLDEENKLIEITERERPQKKSSGILPDIPIPR